MEEQKISGVESPKAIAETPPSTPIPQASSTAAHRPEESLMTVNIEEENYETRLSDIIGGLRLLGSTLQERESEISHRTSDQFKERALARSESSSSLGILKYNEMQSLPGDTLDEDIQSLIQRFEAKLASNKTSDHLSGKNPADRTLVTENEADASDLSVDLRLRLQKELAQRTMERFSLPETPISQHKYSSITNRSFQEGSAVSGETFTINKWPTKLSLDNDRDVIKDVNDPYSFMNEAIRSSSFMSSDRMVQLADFSNESFIPGEQCEQLLVRDEAAWSEENVPPVAGSPMNRSTSQLEFSGVVGNAEISLPNVSTYIGNMNTKVSIGEYFRLKSEDPASLTERCSDIFTPKQQRLKEDKDRESVNTTLSLSQIAGILGKLDSGMSPRTLVAGFLKQVTSTNSNSSSVYQTPNDTPKIILLDESLKDRTIYDPNSSEDSDKTGWMFEVPKTSEGLGSRAYSLVVNDNPQKENNAAAQRTITIEDSIAAGDFSVVKLDETANESVVCLTKELARKPRESVDCSALVPTLKKYCPGIWSDKQNKEFIDASAFVGPMCKASVSMLYPEDENKQIPWASASPPYPVPTICVGVPHEIVIPIENLTARWLICGLKLVHVKLPKGQPDNDNLAIVKLPPKTVLMDPNNRKEAKIEVVPVCEAQMEMELQINLEDVVTKATQKLHLHFTFFGEEPSLSARVFKDDKHVDVATNDTGDPVIDFGVMPEECADHIVLSLYNKGEATVPLRLTVDTKSPPGFGLFFLVPEEGLEDDFEEALVKNRKVTLQVTLEPGTECKLVVLCATPPLNLFSEKEGFCKMSGYLMVTLLSIKPLDLQEIELFGIIGTTKFALQVASQPLKLTSQGLGRSDKHHLPLKNCGRVPITLIFYISERDIILTEDDFAVRPSELKLEPGETSKVIITFTPSSSQEAPVFRTLYIRMLPLGPQYFVELVGTIVKSHAERKAISPVQLHNKIKSLNSSLNSTPGKSKEPKLTAKKSPKEKERILAGSPLLSRSQISQNTRRSSSSNSDSQCEKLRVQSTRRELIWGSVEVGNSVMKTCTIRSLAEHRCRMQVSITDRNNVYKLMNEKGELVTQRKTTLHSNENLVLNVVFNPSKTGPLPAKIMFTHLPGVCDDASGVHIPLYGCGGHARLVVKGIPRDGAGRMWLTLQQQDCEEELSWESMFSVRNLGDLPAFLKVRVVCKGFHHVNESSFIVEPSELVITKGTIENIRVFCRPRPQDLKLLLSGQVQDVIEVATVNLISGDEPTRHRLRRLHKMMMKQNTVQKEKFAEIDLAAITAPFPGERAVPKLDFLKDPLESVHELYHTISLQEVIVLLENNNDRTIQEGDTSRVFHSLYEVDISRTRIEETTCYQVQEETLFTDIAKSPMKCTWSIVPTSLLITLPVNICAVFRLKTDSNRKQPFETCIPAHPPGWVLSLNPSTGFIPAMDELIVVVSCSPSNESSSSRPLSWKGIIQVFIENDLKEVNITVLHNQRSKQDPRPSSQSKTKLPMSPNKTSTPVAASQTGTVSRSELLQKPLAQTQKRSPTKLSRIPVPSVTLAPIIGGYFVSDWTEEHERQNYKAHLERNSTFMEPTSKTSKKSPNSKR